MQQSACTRAAEQGEECCNIIGAFTAGEDTRLSYNDHAAKQTYMLPPFRWLGPGHPLSSLKHKAVKVGSYRRPK